MGAPTVPWSDPASPASDTTVPPGAPTVPKDASTVPMGALTVPTDTPTVPMGAPTAPTDTPTVPPRPPALTPRCPQPAVRLFVPSPGMSPSPCEELPPDALSLLPQFADLSTFMIQQVIKFAKEIPVFRCAGRGRGRAARGAATP